MWQRVRMFVGKGIYDQSRLFCCLGLPSTDLQNDYYETDFIEFLINSCQSILATPPNARLIIAGDINKLDLKSLTQQSGLLQLVKTSTRNDSILDVFLTNTPNIFGKVCTSKSVTKSDHSSVFFFPRVRNPPVRSATLNLLTPETIVRA